MLRQVAKRGCGARWTWRGRPLRARAARDGGVPARLREDGRRGRAGLRLRPRGDDARRGRRPGGQDHQPAHTVVGVPLRQGLADFDWDFQPSVPRAEIEELATLRFVERPRTSCSWGARRGQDAPRRRAGHRGGQGGARGQVRGLRPARRGPGGRLVARHPQEEAQVLRHSRLLIIDELGYLDVGSAGADLLFQLISTRYEQRSTIITTNVGISGWGRVFGDDVAASAIADRVCHHCHLVKITGRSYRLKDLRGTGPSSRDRNR